MLFYFFLTLFIFPHISYYATDSIATSGHSKWLNGRVPLEELENIMLSTPQEDQAREYSRYYTSGPHLGGMNLSQAIWTKERWEEFGIPDVEIVSYDMYTNYPKSHRLALLASNTDNYTPRFKLDAQEYVVAPSEVIEGQSYKLLYEANLSEDVLDEDPTTGLKDRIPTFHGYSAK
jgi:N-acetylated-alpha-linked acidic dipeptidase